MPLKILNYLLPLTTILVSYQYYQDIYITTQLILLVTLCQMLFILVSKKSFDILNIISFAVILIFGILTLYTKNHIYIKLKPTFIYILLSLYLYINYIYKNNIFINIIDIHIVNKLYISWIGFFILLSIINIFIAFSGYFSESQWIFFKTCGIILITLIFTMLQYYFLIKN
ncbi:putative intracellular septation protein A [Candidatus Kinetoplastibacterium sorsogonicusi]|uniref:Putative intracellular septation protein A n=1 Tax=Candidatus Kinetoplastidibacterium kentomonadis TaxID=1576550 RepID=A0A3S7JA68_9PROT|nr:septation protein IspZ [Candidatus Kinetoplastibacterium sorsogonicusi]AWD32572.1 putative intracellular septation protein A [Candidatus Kinetoplastibacterium sorsogonicusi]